MLKINLENYKQFVDKLMPPIGKEANLLTNRIQELNNDVNLQTLLLAGLGISGEAGEITDLVKKILFYGKPLNDETRQKFIYEAGDVLWYIAALCLAFNVNFDDLVNGNVEKLEHRYPEGEFSVERSENRIK